MPQQALERMGEIQTSPVEGAQLLKLDPSVPYLIVLPERTQESIVSQLVTNLGQQNVQATVLVGDLKNVRIFGSLPWAVQPREQLADKYCEGHDSAPAKKSPRKAATKKTTKKKGS